MRDALDILEYTDPTHQPMVPHTFLLAPGMRIRNIWNCYYYWGRPSTAELHGALREAPREIRPDWDPSDPELKHQWEAGDKTSFYPYGVKSMEQTLAEMAEAVDHYAGSA